MKFESFEKYKFQEFSEIPNLEASPLSRLGNNPCDVSESNGDVLRKESTKNSVSFKGSLKLPPISKEAIEGARPTIEFFKKLELGIVGENDKLLAITEGYVMANWEMGEIYGGKVTKKVALFQPKLYTEKIKVYRDAGTGLLYVQEPSGHMAQLQDVDRWKGEGYSYVYKNFLGNEVAVKWK